ncbi:AraC family transcriptional regulator ligand-binding domain-containing protein [Pseudomonas pseudonitroreducens]|uniref:AraC family transcriptional regulator ligand-binding domain-containing protein n=1 Tax=Pseudomonas pseudonitroreducens TaxID=2892326 RepID=UPI001F1EF0AC|nr:AraC family transcriptional regulator ligand-binding domain-containing protein [Pseudomonas pseudonitroreducens]
MRETDRNIREVANPVAQRYHRGPLGQVLERYLSSHRARRHSDYSLIELEQLWLEAASLEPAIGLQLFGQFTPQDWHVIAHLAQFCADVRQAVLCWVRYAPLAADTDTFRLLEDGDSVAVELIIDAPEPLSRYLLEHYSVMAMTQLRRATGCSITPVRACFSHARPEYHTQYRAWFGERIEFGSRCNRLYFDAPTLALPLLGRHAGLVELLTMELDRRLARLRQLSGWAASAAGIARRMLERGEVPALEAIAEQLHQSPRTLRRRLAEQGMGFRELLDQVRKELEQHLELQGESRTRIAERLGYGDLAAYLNARKRWSASGTEQ